MIETILTSIGAFIVAIGVMVTVHEFGHYWVARRCGVKVQRFSVGFGRPLVSWIAGADRTEFVIAMIPLGGYVKFLDEREAPVEEHERHRAFNRQSVPARAAIVAAGPLINIVLAVVCYWAMFVVGVTGIVPNVGGVEPGSPAEIAGFQRSERIDRVGGRETPTWAEVRLALLDRGLRGDAPMTDVVTSDRFGGEYHRTIDVSSVSLRDENEDPVRRLGFREWLPDLPAEVTETMEGSPAERAGLQPGDRVVEVDGEPIDDWMAWVEYVRERPEQSIQVRIQRDGTIVELELVPEAVGEGEQAIGRIGAYGPTLSEADRDRMFTTVRYGPVAALGHGMQRTWDVTTLTLRVVTQLVTGQAALANIAGPVTIAHFAGETARVGLAQFLGFLALISISIGILNLLPIPILDGGHLLYLAIEAVKGSPLSERAQIIGQQIGVVLLFSLIALALYNDFLRLVVR